jgi:hypothetical protein
VGIWFKCFEHVEIILSVARRVDQMKLIQITRRKIMRLSKPLKNIDLEINE